MRAVRLWVLLLAFWMILAGTLSVVDLVMGSVIAGVLAVWSDRFLWSGLEPPVLTWRQALRFLAYIPYLVFEIVRAAIYVAEKVLDPRLPIDPVIVEIRSPLTREISRVALANSITLTPGTLTVDVDGPVFHIHCLAPEFREGIDDRILEHKIARVFEEV